MRIRTISVVENMSGKFDKSEKVVFSTRYKQTHAWEVESYRGPYSEKQLAVQQIFSEATAKAAEDMADPDKKAEWETIAQNSRGKWKTARGAAFASYFAELREQQPTV